MTPRRKRFAIAAAVLLAVAAASALVLSALRSNVAFFYTPTQVDGGEAPQGRAFRVGGLVKAGTLQRNQMTTRFVVTDLTHDIAVSYTGILPDLFKEGRGAVAQGRLDASGQFVASEVLAKHDENYMPPEAQHAMDLAKDKGKTSK